MGHNLADDRHCLLCRGNDDGRQQEDSHHAEHQVLQQRQDNGCYMSFASTGRGGGGLTQAANDNFSIGNGRPGDTATNQTWNGGETYLATVPTPGTTKFTAQVRCGLGGTATFQMNELIAQVPNP
jgi:hypothetical protein